LALGLQVEGKVDYPFSTLVMSQNFEVTREGIKLSYVRFLSDSAAGYILLLLIGVAFSLRLPMPFVGTSWLKVIPAHLNTEDKIFLFFISFLIATPLGLTLNGISWFLLGALPVWLLGIWGKPLRIGALGNRQTSLLGEIRLLINIVLFFAAEFLITGTRRSYHADRTVHFFRLGSSHSKRLYEQANFYEELLSIYFPFYYAQLEPIRGLRRFIRSLSFLALIVLIYSFFTVSNASTIYLALVGFGILLLFNSLLEYYQCLKVLFMTYTLASDLHANNPSRDEIVRNLIVLSARLRSVE
jgi:hypothetical protein